MLKVLQNIISFFSNKSIYKILLYFFIDSLCVTLSLIFALFLKYGNIIPETYKNYLAQYIFLGICFVPLLMLVLKCYNYSIRSFSVIDAMRIGLSIAVGYLIFIILNTFLISPLDNSVTAIAIFISITFLMSYRVIMRFLLWAIGRFNIGFSRTVKCKNTLIYGAGNAGNYLMDRLTYSNEKGLRPVGFIDDDPTLWGKTIKGIKVYGGRSAIPHIFSQLDVKEIILAIPHVENSTIKEIYEYCCKTNCHISRFSNMSSLTIDKLEKEKIKNIRVEDLLGRDEVQLDMNSLKSMIAGKNVLITGGAGSIGSEICRKALMYRADKILIFDTNENGLFEMDCELSENYSHYKYVTIVGSVRDLPHLREVITQYKPHIVFHAAAHKHVPMMEANPLEAIHNNILGTYNTALAAIEGNAEKVVLISTDKAVNPTSIMGLSKRIAELVMRYMDNISQTKCIAVRFGNVLGSNGSVVPTFKRQIEAGGPVTVTHKKMKRYFMTIPEAVKLVFQAAAISTGSEVFVLNMGEPVYIYELACTMIRLSGFIPEKDIKIEITGLRPGEKLFEELKLDSESVEKTQNDQIFVLKPSSEDSQFTQEDILKIQEAVRTRNIELLHYLMRKLVPSYSIEKLLYIQSGKAESVS